jgi:hypothetical protein
MHIQFDVTKEDYMIHTKKVNTTTFICIGYRGP